VSCVSLEQLARAATEATTEGHVAACPRCAALLSEQQAIRALAQALRPAAMSSDRRAALAAEVMAHADAAAPARRHGRVAIAAGGLVAVLAIVLATRTREVAVPSLPVAHDVPAIHVPVVATSPEGAPVEPLAELHSIDGDLRRDTTAERDVITLRGGSVSIDASHTRPVRILAGATRVEVSHARASVMARAGVIEQVAVFAGSVEITTGTTRHVIIAGQTWDRLPEPVAPVQPASSLTAFREGWTQLRANHHAAAIAAFDRATDPVVAEDAVYWAAVAAERLGKPAEARRRFTDFLARFPASPRVEAARAAGDRLR